LRGMQEYEARKTVATHYEVDVHVTPKTIEADSGEGTQHAILAVRVTDETGSPVAGLPKSSFTVYVQSGGAFSEQKIVFFSETAVAIPSVHLPGVYCIETDWAAFVRGTFIFAVTVVHVDPHGRAGSAVRGEGLATLIKLLGPDGGQ
jgi:hypothetical protein